MTQRHTRATAVSIDDSAASTAAIPPATTVATSERTTRRRTTVVFAVVAFLLLAAGWSTNHFATMIAVLRDQELFTPIVVNAAFGIYAVGLVPSLLIGGMLADRLGSRPVVLTGALAAATGNMLILLWQSTPGLFLGRLVIGLGVGLAISAGTAWAGRLKGAAGMVLAGILLTAGFALGPIASGVLAYLLSDTAAVAVPFIVAAALTCLAVIASLIVGDARTAPLVQPTQPTATAASVHQPSMRRALATSIPMALWVFSTAIIALVTLTERVAPQVNAGVLLPGIASLLAFTAGVFAQGLARRFTWGPKAGIVAASIAGAGFLLAGVGGQSPPIWLFVVATLFLGTAYGMALREGLLDVEIYAPPKRRGTTLGIYYVFTYVGFAIPVLFSWMLPVTGYVMPLVVLGLLALGCAGIRAVQIRRGILDRH
ncbi:MFS transporter [Yaniella halotolerans]|uniref:MFS transporter n=1 Tax=Yaniella halotolerans TaxID=225453 RepID=UPI0003B72AA3|nr:MFS transporter [Yaniella halotolerans]